MRNNAKRGTPVALNFSLISRFWRTQSFVFSDPIRVRNLNRRLGFVQKTSERFMKMARMTSGTRS